jgi:hypothetical protein
MTKEQQMTVSGLGGLIGQSIFAIKLSNAVEGYNLIPSANRIGAPIKFAALNEIKIKSVGLIELSDHTEAIIVNGDEKLVFGLNTKFDRDFTNTPLDKIAENIEEGFYMQYEKAATVVLAINKIYADRIEDIRKYVSQAEEILAGVVEATATNLVAFKAKTII